MRHPDHASLLIDLRNYAQDITEIVRDLDKESFLTDIKTQHAIIYEMLVLGEAAKRFAPSFRDAHPEIPWAPLARMRDKLIHGYHDTNLNIIWEVATLRIPELLKALEALSG